MIILLNYTFKAIVPLPNGENKTIYELTLLKSYLFGLVKIRGKVKHEVTMFGSLNATERYWDRLIRDKTDLSKRK